MPESLIGNILTGVGIFGGWYLTVLRFRKEDHIERDRKHVENLQRMDKLEKCVHRHLGGDDDEPIRDRVLTLEGEVKHLVARK